MTDFLSSGKRLNGGNHSATDEIRGERRTTNLIDPEPTISAPDTWFRAGFGFDGLVADCAADRRCVFLFRAPDQIPRDGEFLDQTRG